MFQRRDWELKNVHCRKFSASSSPLLHNSTLVLPMPSRLVRSASMQLDAKSKNPNAKLCHTMQSGCTLFALKLIYGQLIIYISVTIGVLHPSNGRDISDFQWIFLLAQRSVAHWAKDFSRRTRLSSREKIAVHTLHTLDDNMYGVCSASWSQ